jgi:hypothetical protein
MWYGRLLVQLGCFAQAIATSVLFFRRLGSQGSRYSLDNENGLIALSGSLAATLCLVLQLLNCEWKIKQTCAQQLFQRYHSERFLLRFVSIELHVALVVYYYLFLGVFLGITRSLLLSDELSAVSVAIRMVWFWLVPILNYIQGVAIGRRHLPWRLSCLFGLVCSFFSLVVLNSLLELRIYGAWKDPWADVLWAF